MEHISVINKVNIGSIIRVIHYSEGIIDTTVVNTTVKRKTYYDSGYLCKYNNKYILLKHCELYREPGNGLFAEYHRDMLSFDSEIEKWPMYLTGNTAYFQQDNDCCYCLEFY